MEHLVASWKVRWGLLQPEFPINPMEIDSKKVQASRRNWTKKPPQKMLQNLGLWGQQFCSAFFFEVWSEVPVVSGRHDHDSWSVTFMAGR